MRTDADIELEMDRAFDINDVDSILHNASLLLQSTTPLLRARAVGSMGWAYYLRGEHALALEHYHRAFAMHSDLNNLVGMAGARGNLGVLLTSMHEAEDALQHLHHALSLYELAEHRHGIAAVLGNIGALHAQLADYPSAMEYYDRAVVLYHELGDAGGVATFTAGIAQVLSNLGRYPEALERFDQALAILEAIGDRSATSSALINMGNVHLYQENFAKALEIYQRALTIMREGSIESEVPTAIVNIVAAYVGMNNDEEARALLMTLDRMTIETPGVRIWREFNRAILSERSGDTIGARTALELALVEAETHGLRSKTADSHIRLRDLALRQSDLAAYVRHNDAYTQILEEINGRDTAARLAMLEAERRMAKERSEHEKHLAILHSTLPKHVADRVARGETVTDHIDDAAVLFLDVVGFTTHASRLDASMVVDQLQTIFTTFDAICAAHDVMKIKTIGDSYMAAAFPLDTSSCVRRAACAALDMIASSFTWPDGEPVQFRIGLHSGPVVAGVLGTERMQYDVWGDTVNVASRMESTSEPGQIHVSEAFAQLLSAELHTAHSPTLTSRGMVDVKGKGAMSTYWLESA